VNRNEAAHCEQKLNNEQIVIKNIFFLKTFVLRRIISSSQSSKPFAPDLKEMKTMHFTTVMLSVADIVILWLGTFCYQTMASRRKKDA
jgi:hypothetical protein